MKNLKDAKKVYEAIKIPEQLKYMVDRTIANESKPKRYFSRYIKYTLSAVSCVFITFVFMINVNPSLATSIAEIPIIGDIARVFTIKEYKEEDSLKLINAKIPAIENTGNT